MATLITDFVGALNTLKTTGEAQYVGSFCLTSEGTGVRKTQSILRVDTLGYEPPYFSPRTGGLRYWPTSAYGIRKFAESLARDEATEMQARARHQCDQRMNDALQAVHGQSHA